jgi:ParB/RepB/Spo0J family partition protein
MPKKMSLEKFVKQGQAAQEAVDAAVNEATEADALLETAGEATVDAEFEPSQEVVEQRVEVLAIEAVRPCDTQPRRADRMDPQKFAELVASVREKGILQPILVRPDPERPAPAWQIIIGERRWRAAKEAGRKYLPAIVKPMSDLAVFEAQLVENLHHEDLDPIEEGESFRRALDLLDAQGAHIYTQASLARTISKSQPFISNRLRLLKLPEQVQDQVATSAKATEEKRTLTPAHALVLTPFSEYPWIIQAIEVKVKEEGLPPTKQFPDLVWRVLWGDHTLSTALIRPLPLKKSDYYGSMAPAFDPKAPLERNWSQLGEAYAVEGQHAPGPEPCTDCPHRKMLVDASKWGWDERADEKKPRTKEDPFCLLTKCWDRKQRLARAANRQERQEAVADQVAGKVGEDMVRLDTLKHGSFEPLSHRESYDQLLFDPKEACKGCTFEAPDGKPAYRRAYRMEGKKVVVEGHVCLHPTHFKTLQVEAAGKLFQKWKDDQVAALKGLAKQTAKSGLDKEALAGLVLMLLDGDVEWPRERGIGHEYWDFQKARLSMQEFFLLVHGMRDRSLSKVALAKHPQADLEKWVAFALAFRKKTARGLRE